MTDDDDELEVELICICEDTIWLTQVFIAGELKDEAFIDADITDKERSEKIVDDIREKHYSMTRFADAIGQPWLVKMYCPTCKRGSEWDSDGDTRALG